jgi:SAM-dependent methyltransferase
MHRGDIDMTQRDDSGISASPHLDEAAALSRLLADTLCTTSLRGDDCGALHGVWPDLRRLGLAAEPRWHENFYLESMSARFAIPDRPRVLIAGCADSGMLEVVALAARRACASVDVTVVDRCATPLLLCAWLGVLVDVPVRTARSELCDWEDVLPYDLICTHSVLTYGPLDWRRRLVRRWFASLRPGGAVVTVSRLAHTPHAVADGDAERFARTVRDRCERLGERRDTEDLVRRAARFARAQSSQPVGDAADLRSLFEAAGFAVEHLKVTPGVAVQRALPAVSGALRGGAYGEIVAVRP